MVASIYIVASDKNVTLYVDVTTNLLERIYQHRHTTKSFTGHYHVQQLVYCEILENIEQRIQREKQLKKWNRAWKIKLIEQKNPDWQDLSQKLLV